MIITLLAATGATLCVGSSSGGSARLPTRRALELAAWTHARRCVATGFASCGIPPSNAMTTTRTPATGAARLVRSRRALSARAAPSIPQTPAPLSVAMGGGLAPKFATTGARSVSTAAVATVAQSRMASRVLAARLHLQTPACRVMPTVQCAQDRRPPTAPRALRRLHSSICLALGGQALACPHVPPLASSPTRAACVRAATPRAEHAAGLRIRNASAAAGQMRHSSRADSALPHARATVLLWSSSALRLRAQAATRRARPAPPRTALRVSRVRAAARHFSTTARAWPVAQVANMPMPIRAAA